MFKLFYPYEYVDSVFSIDYDKLYSLGYRAIIFDLDNTLVHHGDDSNEEIDRFFSDIRCIGFKTLILTNNDEERVKRFLKNIDSLYICDACKPDVAGYERAVEMLGFNKEQIVYMGDQIFVDILGSNRCGIPSILVKFIRIDGERKIGKKRYLEYLILFFYKNKRKYFNRIGKILKGDD